VLIDTGNLRVAVNVVKYNLLYFPTHPCLTSFVPVAFVGRFQDSVAVSILERLQIP
jgi:hypothetical protein